MSTCISKHGEFSEHIDSDEEFVCGRCHVEDVDAMRTALRFARGHADNLLARIEAGGSSRADEIASLSRNIDRLRAENAALRAAPVPCPACKGRGRIHHRAVMLDNWTDCRRCNGMGTVPTAAVAGERP